MINNYNGLVEAPSLKYALCRYLGDDPVKASSFEYKPWTELANSHGFEYLTALHAKLNKDNTIVNTFMGSGILEQLEHEILSADSTYCGNSQGVYRKI